MVRHAPIHRRSGHSDIAICCGRNVRGSSPSTSVVPLSNQVTTLNHKRFKGFKMFSDGHLESCRLEPARSPVPAADRVDLRPAEFDRYVVAVDEPGFLQAVTECRYLVNGIGSRSGKETDHRYRRSLRAHREATPQSSQQ